MVKYFLVCLLFGCGADDQEVLENRTQLTKGPRACTVRQLDSGAEITCPDGTIAVIYNGRNGIDGLDGIDGVDGVDGTNGKDGSDGESGVDQICKLYTLQEEQ
jgi:hypothetical protein